MKKVIFICLLSVSWCLSLPSDQQGLPAAAAPATNPPAAVPGAPGSAASPAPKQPPAPAAPVNANTTKPTDVPTDHVANDTNSKAPTVPTHAIPAQTNNTSQATPSANDAADTLKPKEENKTTPDKPGDKHKEENKAEIPPTVPPTGNVTPAEKPKNDTKGPEASTPKSPVTVKPTENSKTPQPIEGARGFDGASFVGGIILTLGLLAIGFMGFKYYRNQTERNYHTL